MEGEGKKASPFRWAVLTVSTNRTRLWKAAEEVLESDKCQEKLITETVRCQRINCSPSGGDAPTDKLSGRARTSCTMWLCSVGGRSCLHKSLFTQHSQCVQCGSRCCEGCQCGLWPQKAWTHQGAQAQDSGSPQPLHLGGGGYPSRVQETQRAEFTLLVSEWLPSVTGPDCP